MAVDAFLKLLGGWEGFELVDAEEHPVGPTQPVPEIVLRLIVTLPPPDRGSMLMPPPPVASAVLLLTTQSLSVRFSSLTPIPPPPDPKPPTAFRPAVIVSFSSVTLIVPTPLTRRTW